jgi:hypothetical protein
MARTAISVNTDSDTRDAWTAAAAAAGMSLSTWMAKLANDAVVRAAADRYRQAFADHPDFAAEVAAGRAALRTLAERVRAQRAGAYPDTAA